MQNEIVDVENDPIVDENSGIERHVNLEFEQEMAFVPDALRQMQDDNPMEDEED